jgi:hypothetical protein
MQQYPSRYYSNATIDLTCRNIIIQGQPFFLSSYGVYRNITPIKPIGKFM